MLRFQKKQKPCRRNLAALMMASVPILFASQTFSADAMPVPLSLEALDSVTAGAIATSSAGALAAGNLTQTLTSTQTLTTTRTAAGAGLALASGTGGAIAQSGTLAQAGTQTAAATGAAATTSGTALVSTTAGATTGSATAHTLVYANGTDRTIAALASVAAPSSGQYAQITSYSSTALVSLQSTTTIIIR